MDLQTIVDIIVIVIAILFSIFKIIYDVKINGLRKVASNLILEAENLYEKGKDTDKMNYCINKAISLLPEYMQPYVKLVDIKNIIQEVFDFIKSAMDYQKEELVSDNTVSTNTKVEVTTDTQNNSVITQ